MGAVRDYLPGSLTRSLVAEGDPAGSGGVPFFVMDTLTYDDTLVETLPRLRERIAAAAHGAGREAADVRVVAVTKGHPLEALRAALAAGLSDLGENRVEEMETKVRALGREAATWHMVGHVQSRKAARVLAVADLVHSVDSLRLAEKLSRAAKGEGEGATAHVLVQVNTSGEASKSGIGREAAVEEVHRISELPALRVRGLMTMAPFVDDERVLTDAFSGLRLVLERLREVAPQVGPELSMGMSNDLEVAVREGSTMVRIGTALFGEREP